MKMFIVSLLFIQILLFHFLPLKIHIKMTLHFWPSFLCVYVFVWRQHMHEHYICFINAAVLFPFLQSSFFLPELLSFPVIELFTVGICKCQMH